MQLPTILLFLNLLLAAEIKFNAKNPFEKHSNVVITTFFAPGTPFESELEPIVSPNKAAYASHNSYDYINAFEHEDIREIYAYHQKIHPQKASHYFKLKLIIYLMEKYGYEWIMWSDGDAIFLNFNQKLEQHFDSSFDVIFPTESAEGKLKSVLNTGNVLVKNSEWSYKFFNQAYALSFVDCWDYYEGKAPLNGWIVLCEGRGCPKWNDQTILQYFVSYSPFEEFGRHFKHVCICAFNSEFPTYCQGDMVVHFPGKELSLKKEYLKLFAEQANHNEGTIDWEKHPQIRGIDQSQRCQQSAFDSLNKRSANNTPEVPK